MSNLDKYKVILDKAMPISYRTALSGIGSIMGCSQQAPNGSIDDMPLYAKGAQVCYEFDGEPDPITLDEDVTEGQRTVRATRSNGKKFMASVDYIVNNNYCTK